MFPRTCRGRFHDHARRQANVVQCRGHRRQPDGPALRGDAGSQRSPDTGTFRQTGDQRFQPAGAGFAQHRVRQFPELPGQLVRPKRTVRIATGGRRIGCQGCAVVQQHGDPCPAFRREPRVEFGALGQFHRPAEAQDQAVREGFGRDFLRPHPAPTAAAATGNGRLYCASSVVAASRAARRDASWKVSTRIARCVRAGVVAAAQGQHRLDRRLRPAADRIRLEILLADAASGCRGRPTACAVSGSSISTPGAPVNPSAASRPRSRRRARPSRSRPSPWSDDRCSASSGCAVRDTRRCPARDGSRSWSRPSRRVPMAAQPSAFQAPDV